ncbi:MAG: hypothetical protein JW940_31730 [Polyangiaceae bacterium]|nr:hypothetical protein [Polyangiaceae bacterium]
MRRSPLARSLFVVVFVSTWGCSGDPESSTSRGGEDAGTPDAATGAATSTGGGSASGGGGGAPGASGGTGGTAVSTGGTAVSTGGSSAGTGGASATTGATGGVTASGGSVADGGVSGRLDGGRGGRPAGGSGGSQTGGATTTSSGGSIPGTGGDGPATGGRGSATGGRGSATGGRSGGGSSNTGGMGGTSPGDAGATGQGTGGADSECPSSGNVSYVLNAPPVPTADEADAFAHIDEAMSEAVRYYNCYTDIELDITVNYKTSVPTAEANIDGQLSFGSNRSYMVLPTAMHEIAHVAGIGYYTFAQMHDGNGLWTGAIANAVLASIPNPRDTQLHADNMHFWPYGLNYASEYENEDDLINHCKLVQAIRQDMGL